jgi:hypothetical protein
MCTTDPANLNARTYRYRAVDQPGQVIDVLTSHRAAARLHGAFVIRALEDAALNALSSSIIQHVAIGRRWPFLAIPSAQPS